MGNRGLPCFCSLLLLLPFSPLSCSQSQQSCNSGDLNALQGFVERLESSALGWSFNGSSSSNCCNWAGISCDAGSPLVKRVIGLDLSNTKLNLVSIRLFNISFNSFNGRHPILAGSSNLSVYDVSSNSFSGPVDTGICNSSDSIQMHGLDLASNNLVGEIPSSFKNFTSLSILWLTGNNFSNLFSALQILQSLPNLAYLALSENFHGDELMPSDGIQGFANMELLYIAFCGLSGYIPPWLANLTKLRLVDISRNRLTGTIPSWLGNLDNLFYLDISNNSLTGEIPTSLTRMKSLAYGNSSQHIGLLIRGNSNGHFLEYSSLRPSIILSNNKLVGSILPGFNGLVNLHVLDLSFNNISGTIPDLSGMSNFERYETNEIVNCKLLFTAPASPLASSGNPLKWETGTPLLLLPPPLAPLRSPLLFQSQQSCDSSDLNALQGFVEGLQSSDLGWGFNGRSSSSNCCTWVGISCDLGSALVKRVIGLDLSNKSLKGSVSSSLGGLDQLKQLNLSYNSLRGPVPAELFHLPHLELLDLSTNMLSGLIPAESNLSSIQVFNISFNSFNGTHPILAGSSNVSVYDVSSNSFLGPVDTGICNSSYSIQLLRFSANMFSGDFPAGFGNCSSLSELSLVANGLTGTLPDDLFTLSSLTKINLQGNSLSGTMQTLNLAGNNLVGEIPSSFKNFTSLAILWLSGNNFSNLFSALQILQSLPSLTHLALGKNFRGGELMPSDGIQGFANTELLFIANCALSGSIPPWLANLTKLKIVVISGNHLTGTIPSWLGNLDNLFYLDVSNNSLTGEIPTSLTQMKSLAYGNSSQDIGLLIEGYSNGKLVQYSSLPPSINLSNNKLVGSILPGFNGLVKLLVLDLSRNDISGPIPDLSDMSNLESLNLSHNHLVGRQLGRILQWDLDLPLDYGVCADS
uniref:Leucine-rich repeat-containing N-terminal plant-type domain-containing protein n=1 Tax=Ananas comosus var. bracteatus TaxID=296719 RepID=A0A6V7NS74_ANACO|nr:unnamed protein product [Ananas comosus var. bracteatus]